MPVTVHCDVACTAPVPPDSELQHWIRTVLRDAGEDDAELTIRMVEQDEMVTLNQDYRGRTGTTNVLSFPAERPPQVESDYLGDIVIDAARVASEARDQGKPERAHWAHLVVHGVLHLLGFRHDDPTEAEHMERREREILAEFGYADPYALSLIHI